MVIVKILGGLGNQMFQYAFARGLAHRLDRPVYLDTSQFADYALHDGFLLGKYFSAPYLEAPPEVVRRLSTAPSGLLGRLRRRYFTKRTHFIDRWFGFNAAVLNAPDEVYYDGYWQSEKYFKDIVPEIRGLFGLEKMHTPGNRNFLARTERPIGAIHVRRGDYLVNSNHNVCGIDYYRRALAELAAASPCRTLAVFSDDLNWCRANISADLVNAIATAASGPSAPNIVAVDWNGGDAGADMALMAACDHAIIANSSFSWWAAYLNANRAKTVIAPMVWNRRQLSSRDPYSKIIFCEIVPPGWLRV